MARSDLPGPPRAWRGERVASVAYDGPVAVIGDIHGRSDLLARLMACLSGRTIVVLGDLGDRGPDTRGVIDQLLAVGAIGVLGNHDLWLAAWAAGDGLDPFALTARMGGRATLDAYGVSPSEARRSGEAVPTSHRDFLLGLHLVLDLTVAGTPYWVIHAGIPNDADGGARSLADLVPALARTRPADLLWRANDPETMLPVGRPIVMGHRPRVEPLDTGDVLAIDTGAGWPEGGRLTALLLPERRFVTVG